MGKEKRHKNTGKGNDAPAIQAIVINVANRHVRLLVDGNEVLCSIPRALAPDRNTLVSGDNVALALADNGQYRLTEILPRKTYLCRGNRKSPGEEITMMANIDLLLVVATAKYLLAQAGYVEEAIIAANRAGIAIGTFVSKSDLMGTDALGTLDRKLELYRRSSEFVLVGSALGSNDELVRILSGRRIGIVGDRSCGKTSLAFGILDGLKKASGNLTEAESGHEETRSDRRSTAGGSAKTASTHTITLYNGADGTTIIDTPGFRGFSFSHIKDDERNNAFPEIESLSHRCPFNDCTHTHEDGCRVIEGLREGSIRKDRYDAYKKMSTSMKAAVGKPKQVKTDYRHTACTESFTCKSCGAPVTPEGAGSQHRNHCPSCLASIHVDERPGDRQSACKGMMEPISVWVRKGGEWAIIHRCKLCGALSSNRIASDDNPVVLMSLAVRPLAQAPFPLERLEQMLGA